MTCRVHDTINYWAEPPPPRFFRRASRALHAVRMSLRAGLGADAGNWEVHTAGSVKNMTATVCSSDVDLHVLRKDRYAYRLPEKGPVRELVSAGIQGPIECGFSVFRNSIENVMRHMFGPAAIGRSKAIQIVGNHQRLDADIVVGLEYRHYTGGLCACGNPSYHGGVELRSRGDVETPVICYPGLRSEHIEVHDKMSGGRYRPVVRIMKCVRRSLRDSDDESLRAASKDIPSCLIESVFGCLPPEVFQEPGACHWPVVLRAVPAAIELIAGAQDASQLLDLGGVEPLFGASKTWSPEQVVEFLSVALSCLKARDIPL